MTNQKDFHAVRLSKSRRICEYPLTGWVAKIAFDWNVPVSFGIQSPLDRRGMRQDESQQALTEVRAVYAELAKRPLERSCQSLTGCCQFQLTGLTPQLTKGEALVAALEAAVRLYGEPRALLRVRRNGMARDFSWEASARKYLQLYRQANASRRMGTGFHKWLETVQETGPGRA